MKIMNTDSTDQKTVWVHPGRLTAGTYSHHPFRKEHDLNSEPTSFELCSMGCENTLKLTANLHLRFRYKTVGAQPPTQLRPRLLVKQNHPGWFMLKIDWFGWCIKIATKKTWKLKTIRRIVPWNWIIITIQTIVFGFQWNHGFTK